MPAPSFESARDELYGLDPDAFMARRGELAKAARDAGDAATAKQIGALRKPNRSAFVVNSLVRAETDVADRLGDLGDRLRDAQRSLDGALMRELSTERTKAVDELTRAAFRAAGVRGPTAALRDDVAATLNAAIADPEVLDRVAEGALVRPESWSGFGAVLAPALHVVTGSDAAPRKPATSAAKTTKRTAQPSQEETAEPAEPTAARRARERREARIAEADIHLAEARRELKTAETDVAARTRAVKHAEEQLRDARRRLDDAQLAARRAAAEVAKAEKAVDRLSP